METARALRPNRRTGPSGLAACLIAAALPAACEFHGAANVPSTSQQFVIVNDEDRLHAVHGETCTDRISGGVVGIVQDSLPLPEWASEATVFLNGWRFEYPGVVDHHIAGLGVTLSDVMRADGLLRWQAVGALADRRFDDDHRWCYDYTAIAWNGAVIDARPEYLSAESEIRELADLFDETVDGNSTALKARFRLIEDRERGPAAVLPMGFGLKWDDNDHHLLQLSYDLGGPSRFLEAGRAYVDGMPELAASQASSGAITWVSESILKDNKLVRDYDTGEVVSIVTGRDVGFIVPPYAILPVEDNGPFEGCILPTEGEKVRQVVIEQVPFEYAFPVLTGWDLNIGCDDEHIHEVAIGIDTVSYTAGSGGGTLSYRVRSEMRDKDGDPGHGSSERVAILGFLPTTGGAPTVAITRPAANTMFAPGETVRLIADAEDPEDGSLAAGRIRWFSDRDGFLGTGEQLDASLSGPECGGFVTHVLRAEATDSNGNRTNDRVEVLVGRVC